MYSKQCGGVLELAGLTVSDSNQMERVKKLVFAIILGDGYNSFSTALRELKMDCLMPEICKNILQSDKFNKWFSESECISASGYCKEI